MGFCYVLPLKMAVSNSDNDEIREHDFIFNLERLDILVFAVCHQYLGLGGVCCATGE